MMMTGALSIEVRRACWGVPQEHVCTYRPCCLRASMLFVQDKCQFYTQTHATIATCMRSTPIILSRVTFDLDVYTAIILSSSMSQVIESIAFEHPLRSKVDSFRPQWLGAFAACPIDGERVCIWHRTAMLLGLGLSFWSHMKLIRISVVFIWMISVRLVSRNWKLYFAQNWKCSTDFGRPRPSFQRTNDCCQHQTDELAINVSWNSLLCDALAWKIVNCLRCVHSHARHRQSV